MAEYVLETRGLGIRFGGLKAASDVNIRIRKNQIYGLIGPNGAGKTTIFNMVTGVYTPTEGEIMRDGVRINGLPQEKINHMGIARTLTVVRNVMVGLHNDPRYRSGFFTSVFRLPKHFRVEEEMRSEAKKLLELFGLLEVRNELASNLPYGKQRRLEIARALATKPRLLLLDEPAAGMNHQETEELMDTIRKVRDKFDIAVLLIEHDMSLVSGICDSVTVLNFGTVLAQGDVETALSDPEVIRAYLGDDN